MEGPTRLSEPVDEAGSQALGWETALRGKWGVIVIAAGALIALLIPLFGPVIAIIMGIAMRKTPRAMILTVLGGLLLAIELYLILFSPGPTN